MQSRHHPYWPPGLPKSLDYPRTSMFYNFEVSARRYPDRPCLVFYGKVITYAEAARRIEALAGWLQHAAGVRRGDRVLLDLQNSPQFVLAFYAILRADAVVVPVNPMSRVEELRHYVTDSQASAAFIAQDTIEHLLPLVGPTPLAHVAMITYADELPADPAESADLTPPPFVREPARAPMHPAVTPWREAVAFGERHAPDAHAAGPDDMACLPYTSGSTGWPKGCVHTHATMMVTCVQIAFWKQLNAEAVSLATAPFFHVTGMVSSMNAPLYVGCTSVVLPRWDAVVAARLIERFKVTNWTNVPTMVVDLLSNPEAARHDLSSLKHIAGGGSAMPESIAATLKERYGLDYIEGYGMTEFMSATHMNPPHRPKKQCLGIPAFDVDARIIDPDTLAELGPREQGEIIAACPQRMRGYWQQPQATRDALIERDGKTFFRTGDLGYMDDEGYFFMADRLKRMINASGFKVWPAEVENFFYQHPAIQECCIVASPDARRGETVKLVAVLRPGHEALTEEALVAWARERMAAYKVPRKVEFLDALPRTSSGKLYWRKLQDREFGRE